MLKEKGTPKTTAALLALNTLQIESGYQNWFPKVTLISSSAVNMPRTRCSVAHRGPAHLLRSSDWVDL